MKKANDADLRTFYSNSLSIVACGKYVIKKIEMYKLNFQLYAERNFHGHLAKIR